MALEQVLHHSEHLKLSTVAVVVFHQVTGTTPQARNPERLDDILNRVAVAIASLVPVYAFDRGGAQHILQPVSLIEGKLYAGATILRCLENGEMMEYRGLSVRRADVEKAIAGLRHARLELIEPEAA
jgi:hypothetical protein